MQKEEDRVVDSKDLLDSSPSAARVVCGHENAGSRRVHNWRDRAALEEEGPPGEQLN